MNKENVQNDQQECLVSVLMLCYNHEKYIRLALDSVLMQKTTFKFEIIVNDDASLDRSPAIIEEYADRFPHIIKPIFQKQNLHSKRISAYYTLMMPVASGKYIASCEGDDYWIDEYKLQKQVEFMEQNTHCSAIAHNCKYVDKEGNETIGKSIYGPFRQHVHTIKYYQYYPDIFPGQTATVIFRRDVINQLSESIMSDFLAIRSNGDKKKNLVLLLHGDIYFLDEFMSAHRIVRDSGDSWTARTHGTNYSGRNFISHLDCKRFAIRHYKRNIMNHYSLFHCGLAVTAKRFMNNDQVNEEEYRLARDEFSSTTSFFLFILYCGVMSLPTGISKLFRFDAKMRLKNN